MNVFVIYFGNLNINPAVTETFHSKPQMSNSGRKSDYQQNQRDSFSEENYFRGPDFRRHGTVVETFERGSERWAVGPTNGPTPASRESHTAGPNKKLTDQIFFSNAAQSINSARLSLSL